MATRVEPLRGRIARLPIAAVRERYVLASLVVIQWAAVAMFAVTVRHNGWIWYQGGDQLWHYTSGWLLAHGRLPPSLVGYGWPFVLAPFAAVAGANLASALPAIVVLQLALLLPIALLAMYGIGSRIAGRWFGTLVALLWIGLPYFGIRYTLPGYHQRYTEIALPQSLGLTGLSDFPGVVALIVSAYFALRALDGDEWLEGAAAGIAAGVAIAIKPSNGIFLLALGLFFLAYRLRAFAAAVAGIAPFVLTLALWKQRGLGQLPIFAQGETRLVLAATVGATASILSPLHHYVHLDWSHLNQNRLGIKEHFWSERLVDWSIVAGLIGLLRRSRAAFVLIGVWFVAYVIVKGTYFAASTDDASFFRFLMPAFPAFVLLIASVVFLVPGTRARNRASRVRAPSRRTHLALVVGAAVVLGVFPLGVVAGVKPLDARSRAVALQYAQTLRPVDGRLQLRARVVGDHVHLRWNAQSPAGGTIFYQVVATRGRRDLTCTTAGSALCTLNTHGRGTTRRTTFTDSRPPGVWTYRVGVVANWLNDRSEGDSYVFSEPVAVTVRRR